MAKKLMPKFSEEVQAWCDVDVDSKWQRQVTVHNNPLEQREYI